VGERMTANADLALPPLLAVSFSPRAATRRSNTGVRNATVFPLPVRAMTHASEPVKSIGNDLRCTGVGVRYPSFLMPAKMAGERLSAWNPLLLLLLDLFLFGLVAANMVMGDMWFWKWASCDQNGS